MSIFSDIIDVATDWWDSGDVIGDVIGAADAFLGPGGSQAQGQGRALRTRFDEGRFHGKRAGATGRTPAVSPPAVAQQNEYHAMRDEWRARLRRAQDFADTSDEVIRAPTGTQARRS